ncbi:MAG: MBL fold metallo-hydrolase [Solimonas sp.]
MSQHFKPTLTAIAAAATLLVAGCHRQEASLDATARSLGAAELHSIEFSGTGRWYQFGQAPNPHSAWPAFELSRYVATIDYDQPAARVQQTRKQIVEPGRERPQPVEQKPDQYLSGETAWNLAPPQGAAPGAEPVAQAQPAAVEERRTEIWETPQGFVKAALANHAEIRQVDGGSEVSFSIGPNHYVGFIDAGRQLTRVRSWIDNPVLGDTLVETTFSDYRDFSGLSFPAHIARSQGGYPVLDLDISTVTANAPLALDIPAGLDNAPPQVTSETLAPGVFYLRGGTHHSVAIEEADHVVVVEAPLNEARSEAVIAKVHELIPDKPIRYLVNTHAHFDHAGGLRTYVAEDATIVTHADNEAYYREAWSARRTLQPDRLSQTPKAPHFETFRDKKVLGDEKRPIEIYPIAGSGHNDAFALVYLPAEKILIEADAYTPLTAGAPPPASVNPYAANLYDNIDRLKLDVQRIAALHGPGVATLADLKAYITPAKS